MISWLEYKTLHKELRSLQAEYKEKLGKEIYNPGVILSLHAEQHRGLNRNIQLILKLYIILPSLKLKQPL